ncbi:MAG: hypothetical protein WAV40_02345 [Microgenomates group bacterium]
MSDPITPTLPDPQATVDAALGNPPMKDETPLAFAAPTLNALPPTPPTTAPTAPPQPAMPPMPEPAPSTNTESSYLPPVPPAPLNNVEPEAKPKTKSKIMLVVLGIFGLLGMLGTGGYYVYTQMAKTGQIAYTGEGFPYSEAECPKHCDGTHALAWKGQYGCRWSGETCNGGGTTPPAGGVKSCPPGGVPDPNDPGRTISCTCTGNYTYCGGIIDKCVSNADLAAAGGGCNKYGESIGIPTTYGASCKVGSTTDKIKWVKTCNCADSKGAKGDYLFDRNGDCIKLNADNVDTGMGLCGIVKNGACAPLDAGGNTTPNPWSCDATGCRILSNVAGADKCFVMKFTCAGTKAGQSCLDGEDKPPSQSKSFDTAASFCGKVQQIDVSCGPGKSETRTKIFPPCGSKPPSAPPSAPPSSPPNTPVIACTGLTQTPATTPVIGQTVTFTCAGTITPASAGTLSYKFRYSLDNGADQLLENKTATTAELNISACGTYSVQCKACATISGVLTCDPVWTGAVQ